MPSFRFRVLRHRPSLGRSKPARPSASSLIEIQLYQRNRGETFPTDHPASAPGNYRHRSTRRAPARIRRIVQTILGGAFCAEAPPTLPNKNSASVQYRANIGEHFVVAVGRTKEAKCGHEILGDYRQ